MKRPHINADDGITMLMGALVRAELQMLVLTENMDGYSLKTSTAVLMSNRSFQL